MAHILLVDDDTFFRKMVGFALTSHGHTVVEAENGMDGLKKLSLHTPDLVISDIIMPEKEGLEFIRKIRDLIYNMPIIAVSAGGVHENAKYLRMAESLGATTSMQKPIDANQLLATIDRLLNVRLQILPT